MTSPIFISHADSDKKTAKRLYDDLKQAGLNPWMESIDLLPGQNRKLAIKKAIRSSRHFLALLSEKAISKRGLFQMELKIARDFQDEFPADGIFLIPVRVEACEPVDSQMQELTFVDLFPSYEEGVGRLMRTILPGGVEAESGGRNEAEKGFEEVGKSGDLEADEPVKLHETPSKTVDGMPISPGTTLAVILGASAWPKWKELGEHPAFQKSAEAFVAYLKNGFGMPDANICNLFDSEKSPNGLDEAITDFLEKRKAKLKQAGNKASDLLIFYTGHGNLKLGNDDFYLALRSTRKNREDVSGLGIKVLAATLKDQARHLRRFLILDCCFAAAAEKYLQSGGVGQAVAVQALGAFKEMPKKGTSVLCSSSSKTPSEIAPDGEYTMFSEALLHVLENGHSREDNWLSISSLGWLTRGYLKEKYRDAAVRPEVHSPVQDEGDIALLPMFPNPASLGRDDFGESAELTGLDESVFIAELFERFHTNNPNVLLGQDEREQLISREMLIDYFSERYGAENVVRLVPVRGKNVTIEQYFAYLGRQFQPRENLNGSFDFITCIEDRLEQVDRLFLMVHGFEGGSEEGTEELASAFLTLLEHDRSKLHLLISGGERLAEMTMHGALSYLKSAKIVEWPELTAKDVMMLCPDNSIDDETAKHILKLTGGHPRLITRCIDFCRKHGRFDEFACREHLLKSRYIQSLFFRILKTPEWGEPLIELLEREISGPNAPYIQDNLQRRLFWLNLLRKSDDQKQLLWRCEVIQKIGLNTL